ncbi:hypothetical protein [Intestinibacillus sp. Marseille-P6563]|uniref:hypothetical protein n=1 Tax=Intestinibacillus sp. Marseille-P6563 TaxID=2364792 RepID=UPI000F071D33|nr:hypothetical protein [Intestinibacillus sp. Marseille-P6563]
MLIAAGTNLQTVAARLGHANTTTTSKIYAHAIRSADEAAAEALQDILHPIKKSIEKGRSHQRKRPIFYTMNTK